MYIIDQARGQDRWILAKFSFCIFMDLNFISVHKNAKRERGQYLTIFTELAWSTKDLLYGIKNTEKMILVLVYFRALKRKPVICKSDNAFQCSHFLIPPRQRNHRKIFLLSQKIFCRRKLSCTHLDFDEMFLREQNRQSRVGSIAPILPARVANHSAGFGSSCPLAVHNKESYCF